MAEKKKITGKITGSETVPFRLHIQVNWKLAKTTRDFRDPIIQSTVKFEQTSMTDSSCQIFSILGEFWGYLSVISWFYSW